MDTIAELALSLRGVQTRGDDERDDEKPPLCLCSILLVLRGAGC